MSIPCKGDHTAPCRRVSMAQHDLAVLAAVRSIPIAGAQRRAATTGNGIGHPPIMRHVPAEYERQAIARFAVAERRRTASSVGGRDIPHADDRSEPDPARPSWNSPGPAFATVELTAGPSGPACVPATYAGTKDLHTGDFWPCTSCFHGDSPAMKGSVLDEAHHAH
jgi:hypothetical protein